MSLATNAGPFGYHLIKNGAGGSLTRRFNLKFGSDFTVADSSPDTVISLAVNALTVTAGTGLSGGGSVALGGTTTLSVNQAFSPTWSGTQTFTGSAVFNDTVLKINNPSGTAFIQLATTASTTRTWTFPDGNTTGVGTNTTQTLTNKTISGASNTLTNIANGSLTNSSLTVTAGTGLAGGGAVALGASVTLSLPSVGPGAGSIGGGSSVITSVTLDAQGRVTAATSGAPVALGSRAVDTQLTTTSATSVATYTPGSTKALWVGLYYRVMTATTDVTITITYTDASGGQTLTAVPLTATTVGSYAMTPIFLVATNAAVTVTATGGTANQVFVSASIIEA